MGLRQTNHRGFLRGYTVPRDFQVFRGDYLYFAERIANINASCGILKPRDGLEVVEISGAENR
jgi:hypothetical protein